MNRVMVVAPHPDDETLGCGGTLLSHRASGDEIHWLLVTQMTEEKGFSPGRIVERDREIETVQRDYGFSSITSLGYPTCGLRTGFRSELVERIGKVVREKGIETLYLPHPYDAHSDHWHVFEAATAASKWFRYPTVTRILAYETLSETDQNLNPGVHPFRGNVFVDVTAFLDRKIEIMSRYQGEFQDHPFPRSAAAIRALACLRGAASGFHAAECFALLMERRT